MFMFVSGYFFKETNTFWTNTKRATKKVLIPYLLWSFVGWGIAFGLTFVGLNWCSEITTQTSHIINVDRTLKML